MIIDGLVRHFTKGKKAYDAGGRWAAKGHVIEPLLDGCCVALLRPATSQKRRARAIRPGVRSAVLPRRRGDSASPLNAPSPVPARLVKTPAAVHPVPRERAGNQRGTRPAGRSAPHRHRVDRAHDRRRARALRAGQDPIHRLIVSGGGAHNRLLVARLAELLPSLSVHRSDEFGLDVDAKEAIAFAVLADRTLHGLPGNLPAVTGARRAVVLGKISRPQVRRVLSGPA